VTAYLPRSMRSSVTTDHWDELDPDSPLDCLRWAAAWYDDLPVHESFVDRWAIGIYQLETVMAIAVDERQRAESAAAFVLHAVAAASAALNVDVGAELTLRGYTRWSTVWPLCMSAPIVLHEVLGVTRALVYVDKCEPWMLRRQRVEASRPRLTSVLVDLCVEAVGAVQPRFRAEGFEAATQMLLALEWQARGGGS
jgi:hypothetical protein